ncbi:trypsin-like serine peptidase [Streptacidiphilus jiangxiensis]|uniref:trypsin-like serine peptidase n=1 Tax=Streptacidiphilus jiangxiensis TaxID=235985 RepID=UPI0006942FBA|nr:trypsin-like serine protease [Streptacidiphilus jiangxiensis]
MTRAQLRSASRALGVLAFAVCFVLVLVRGGIGSGSRGEDAQALAPTDTRRAVPALPGPAAHVPASLAGAQASPDGHSTPFDGLPAVGALFYPDDASYSHHFCTASVVHSPGGDVVATAAHCLSDPAQGSPNPTALVFAPGYHDGQYPFGLWRSTAILIDPHWAANSDQDSDVAFLVVHKDGDPNARIENEVGAERIAFGADRPAMVGVIGYPSGTDRPISCLNKLTAYSTTQSEFDCTGFTDGASGGPVLQGIDPHTGLGTLVGVIGGYQEGGDTDDVSYSVYFGDRIQALYGQAVAAGTPSASASASASEAASPSGSPSQ